MLERMKKEYGTEPSDVKVGIGPSIGASTWKQHAPIEGPIPTFTSDGSVPVSYTHLDVYKRQVRQPARPDGM